VIDAPVVSQSIMDALRHLIERRSQEAGKLFRFRLHY
jgi:hypothetical protein